MSIHVFGIRHHGPGSAKSMLHGLRQLNPDIILIEGPPDGDQLIAHVANEKLHPPVALLVYNPKNLQEASYYPFANFSPEWQAMKFALKREIPVSFMDLPRSLAFTLDRAEKENTQLSILTKIDEDPEAEVNKMLSKEQKKIAKDPFGYLAKLAGFTDSERWWEVMFEATQNTENIFPAITEMIDALRQESGIDPPIREKQREAYMRQCIRKAVKAGHEKIAIICGAWHSPALQYIDRYKGSHDKTVLKGIKKTSTKTTWVPWTFEQLSMQSGYGAGVISPAWYHLLFNQPNNVVIRWMTKVARLFRKEDMDSSSAHIIEAVRLAETLATLRQLPIPGIEEMQEAAIAIFCQGYESQMEIIQRQLIIGDVMGKVPPEIPVIPLQQDLDKQIKSARLTKYRNTTEAVWLKATSTNPRGGIDLREPTDRIKSHLLHRLNILTIPWGKIKKGSKRDTGSFKEYWKLQWKAGFAISIIEAGMWGNTVEKAATAFLLRQVQDLKTLPELTERVEAALNGNLPNAIQPLIQRLQDVSSLTKDVFHLMEALPPLINALRYGSSREIAIEALQEVVDQMIPRICVALPNACIDLDEDAAKNVFEKILATNRSISLLEQSEHHNSWNQLMKTIVKITQVHRIISGACCRILFDKGVFDTNLTATQMHYALSRGNDSAKAAHWVEGFLHGSGLLLIHHPGLWNILDDWVDSLLPDVFQDILPLLRRTFAEFSGPERAKMMALAKRGPQQLQETSATSLIDEHRANKVVSVVNLLLGN